MTSRVLPSDEWVKLAGTETGWVLSLPIGMDVEVLVVEDGSVIVGSWAVMRCDMLEGCRAKNRLAARHLIAGMRELLKSRGSKGAVTTAPTGRIAAMLEELGAVEIPGRQYAVSLESRLCQP